jgi:hypothetical protein
MSSPDLVVRQREMLRDLLHAAAERARDEPGATTLFRAEVERTEQEYAAGVAAAAKRLASDEEDADRELAGARLAVDGRFNRQQQAAIATTANEREGVLKKHKSRQDKAKAAYQDACLVTGAIMDDVRTTSKKKLRDTREELTHEVEELEARQAHVRNLLEEWKQPVADFDAAAERETAGGKGETTGAQGGERTLSDCWADVEALIARIEGLILPRFLKGKRFALLMCLLWLALVYPLGMLVVWYFDGKIPNRPLPLLFFGIIASTVLVPLASTAGWTLLAVLARRQVRGLYLPFCSVLVEAKTIRHRLVEQARAACREELRQGKKHHNEEVRAAFKLYRRRKASIKRKLDRELAEVDVHLKQRQAEVEQRRAAEIGVAEQRCQARKVKAKQRHVEDLRHIEQRCQRRLTELRANNARDWEVVFGGWQQAMNQLRQVSSEIAEQIHKSYPPWDDPTWTQWMPPDSPPPAVCFGSFEVRIDQVPNGMPSDERLRAMTPAVLQMPALCPFPSAPSLMLEAGEEGRVQAVTTLQAVLFRLLTAIPAGKLRSVIIDPVGLGQNFATFMHLTDYDKQLVNGRIWTEVAHIEQRLNDLTVHMENVIQKYLRNRFADISEYNSYAGEVAEAFRVLVIANFPVHFSDEAVRRLVSIVQSGPRCGVFTLLSVDTRQPLPKGFDLADLRKYCSTLVYSGDRITWQDDDFGPYPLTLQAVPPDAMASGLLEKVGEAARAGQRVQVPFEYIVPAAGDWWKGDSRDGVSVALGRCGATQRQHLELGHGTSQHVVIAGKTGSGKSTLLHALITNISLIYSPDEVEVYLVDFKKGVEFKTYATHSLPHARVIAIESEREFGLSVLQRLDAELKARGERFREAGAQNLADYRNTCPDAVIPRVLLIVDEFQEFFTEDDRIAQEASQLLDRLVRQGRAFGMHVLLGSQTLGGAYSLARSTIDQMAVRIALQCSEADAQLILSDDNSAARLLSRPGEAIYNDANGLVEGNHPFQVVWLDEVRREDYLGKVHDLARARPPRLGGSPVIFEGNIPADVTRNPLLAQFLAAGRRPDTRNPVAWLGDALAINGVTSAPFRRQSGSNLMIIGQQEEAALGMVAIALVGLVAQSPAETQMFVVDGRQVEAPSVGVAARLPEVLPVPVRLAGWRDAAPVITEVAAEVERRQKAPETTSAPVYLVLFGLQRMRDLRRAEDDFGFGRPDGPPAPPQQLATILREGPTLGVHTLLWCDNLNNLQRYLDRNSLREVGLRVVFQMGVADSSNLIDSPAASKLGLHRALFFSEEDGRLEKFRPYGVPPDAWLEQARRQLRANGNGTATAAASATGVGTV